VVDTHHLKHYLKKIVLAKELDNYLKKEKEDKKKSRRLKANYKFYNRKKNSNILCLILAGYKEFAWDKVFSRIIKYIPQDIDICVASSGIYSKRLDELCRKNNWSYLSLKDNCVTLTQNVAIHLHEKAEFILKIDEDVFITKHFFDNMVHTYSDVILNGRYDVGFVAPLIPVNGYGYVRVLEKLGLVKEYEKRFEKVKYIARRDKMIENNPEVAKFFWGKGKLVMGIDDMDEKFAKNPYEYHACPIRLSIGAILLPRKTWKDMGYFTVEDWSCVGLDEKQLNKYCIIESKSMIVSENVVVGHLSFGNQNEEMKKYFLQHPESF
jgi:hypothetical protein